MACTAFSAVAKAVMITTSVRGDSAFTLRSRSSPDSRPSRRSLTTRSGSLSRNFSRAPPTSPAVKHRVPLLGEEDLEELPHGELVVDDQDARHALS